MAAVLNQAGHATECPRTNSMIAPGTPELRKETGPRHNSGEKLSPPQTAGAVGQKVGLTGTGRITGGKTTSKAGNDQPPPAAAEAHRHAPELVADLGYHLRLTLRTAKQISLMTRMSIS
eukprot:1683669-Amphidinium_carterae.1